MKELEQAGAGFEADAAKDDLEGLLADISESTINDIAENLPNIVFKINKSIQLIRNYETMNKVLAFLNEFRSMEKREIIWFLIQPVRLISHYTYITIISKFVMRYRNHYEVF